MQSPSPSKMSFRTKEYASSTFSESTTYSYDKSASTMSKPKRSFRERAKGVIKSIGTSPFEYEDDVKAKETAGWLSSLPPSKI